MPDEIIKNPNRMSTSPTQDVPEYIRKKITPLQMNTLSFNKEFVSLDGVSLDKDGNEDDSLNKSGHVIDNNDYVNLGFDLSNTAPINKPKIIQDAPSDNTEPNIGEYILMVRGKMIESGSLEKIETRVKDIMYGDDSLFEGTEISVNDIIVLKRLKIKVGIFIDR